MSTRQPKLKRIPGRSVFVGIVLLFGILSMVYGYYGNDQVFLYVGLAITIMGTLNGIIFSGILPNIPRTAGHRH